MKIVIVHGLLFLAAASAPVPALAAGSSVGVGVFQLPKTEHWRANFKPDSYSLDDYDGRQSAMRTICGQKGSHTLSTKNVECDQPGDDADEQRTLTTK